MKKIFYFSVLILTIISLFCLFYSCNNNEIKKENDITREFTFNKLKLRLDSLNENFTYTYPILNAEGTLKSQQSFWTIFKRIAAYDLTGVIVGGVFAAGPGGVLGLGILSSLIGMTRSETYQTVMPERLPKILKAPSYSFETNDVGADHNELIVEILNEHPELLDTRVDIEILKSIVYYKIVEKGITIERNIFDYYNVGRIERITEIVETSNDGSELILKMRNDYPQIDLELDIVDVYLERASAIQSERVLMEYTEEFMQIVDSSEVPIDSKQTINSGLSVYANSASLW